jgi:hypothetical protein
MIRTYEEILGEELVAQAKARLSARARESIEQATVLTWVPLDHVGELVDRIGIEAERDPDALLDEVIPRTVERTVNTVWRVLFRFTSDQALIARTPLLWSKSRNIGQLSARIVEPGVGEVELTGWPDVSDRHLRTLARSLEAVMRVAGRDDVRVSRVRRPMGASFRVTWTKK